MYGSLAEPLSRTPEGRNVLASVGPISDAYIVSTSPVSLIIGPPGSGKTTASVKKALFEAVRIHPGPDGLRRYVLGVWRQSYVNLWNATIKSWWKILPDDKDKLPGATWTGSSPRPAQQVVRFRDQWSVSHGSEIELVVQFRAFNDAADPEDVLGTEFTDCYFNEMPTLPEKLFTALVGRVGRDPPYAIIKREGRVFGDGNAPDVTNYCYRDFYETLHAGYALFKQPGGRDPGAENLAILGPNYYNQMALLNSHQPWWVRLMVDCRPGFNRDTPVVYETFDDEVNLAKATLQATRHLPVLVGIDGGYTPAAAYMQEMPDGQLRVLGEVPIERGRMKELGRAMLAFEARRFPGCDFSDWCDPSMNAGEDIEGAEGAISELSDRQKLQAIIGRPVSLAVTNETKPRIDAFGDKLALSLGPNRPGLLLDPSCKVLRRAFNQTYHYRVTQGGRDISSIVKTPDGHTMEAGQYAALQCGSAHARRRNDDAERERVRRRQEAREAPRYDPLRRRGAG